MPTIILTTISNLLKGKIVYVLVLTLLVGLTYEFNRRGHKIDLLQKDLALLETEVQNKKEELQVKTEMLEEYENEIKKAQAKWLEISNELQVERQKSHTKEQAMLKQLNEKWKTSKYGKNCTDVLYQMRDQEINRRAR